MSKTITIEDLSNPENLVQCECGSFCHLDHAFHDSDSGTTSCPECRISWLNMQIDMWKTLAWKVADPAMSFGALVHCFKSQYAEMIGCQPEDVETEIVIQQTK